MGIEKVGGVCVFVFASKASCIVLNFEKKNVKIDKVTFVKKNKIETVNIRIFGVA